MPQKIKIIKLEKPRDYILKQIESIKASQKKMLADSDWTQLMDCPLALVDCIKWKYWRHKVRTVQIYEHNYEDAALALQTLNGAKPKASNSKLKMHLYTKIIFDTPEEFIQTSSVAIKEIFPNKRKALTMFMKRVENCKDCDTIFSRLVGILNGY